MTDTLETIKFAILGSGMIAQYHRQAIEANAGGGARLSAVVHYDPSQFATMQQAYGVPCMTQEEMLSRSDIDVVCICTPSGLHAEQAVAAARAGKHVLIEKPLALSLEEADRIIEACDEAGVQGGVVLQRRAEPLFQRVHHVIAAGGLGDLTMGVVTMPYFRPQSYYDSAAWRGTWALDGGGVLMNQGIHIIDLLVWYMGDPAEVAAWAGTAHRDIEVEDTACALVRFATGSSAVVAATTTAEPGFPHRLEIYGTRGGVQIEGESVVRWTTAAGGGNGIEPLAAPADAGAGGAPGGIQLSGHKAIIADFMEAIRLDRKPLCDVREGRRSLAAVLAIYEAAGLRTA